MVANVSEEPSSRQKSAVACPLKRWYPTASVLGVTSQKIVGLVMGFCEGFIPHIRV
jgi:hypothetical protein